jgi:hypothetical protein
LVAIAAAQLQLGAARNLLVTKWLTGTESKKAKRFYLGMQSECVSSEKSAQTEAKERQRDELKSRRRGLWKSVFDHKETTALRVMQDIREEKS